MAEGYGGFIMSFNWKGLVKTVAPKIATVLGGPMAGLGVKALSNAILGKPDGTEDELEIALAGATPEMLGKIKAADQAFELEMKKQDIEIIGSVNDTMQVESKSDNWWTSGWRPYWGFVSGTAFLFVCILVCYLMYQAVINNRPEMMALIPPVITAFTTLFAIPGAILGVTAWHRGKMQRGK